jgi:hypothetical protein
MFIKIFIYIWLEPILWVQHTQIVYNPMNRELTLQLYNKVVNSPTKVQTKENKISSLIDVSYFWERLIASMSYIIHPCLLEPQT